MFDKLKTLLSALRTPRPTPFAAPPEPQGIPSDAFFFAPAPAHPDGSTCGAGCGSQ